MVDAPEKIWAASGSYAETNVYCTPYVRADIAEREKEELRKELERTKLHASAWEDSARLNKDRAETAERQLAERDADLARKNALLLKASVGFEPFSEVGNAMTFAGVTANDEIELAGERLRPALVAAVTIKREIDLVIAVPAYPSTAGER